MSPSAYVDVTDCDFQGWLYDSHFTDGKLRLGGTAKGTDLSQKDAVPSAWPPPLFFGEKGGN